MRARLRTRSAECGVRSVFYSAFPNPCFVLLACWLSLLAVPALAANPSGAVKPLRLSVLSILPRARSQAPQTIELVLNCESSELLQGRLEIDWYRGKRLVHRYVSQELALTFGTQKMRVAMPAIRVDDDRVPITGYPRFVTDRQVIELKETDVVVPVEWKRAFVLVNVQPREVGRHEAERGIADSLALEKFNPHPDMRFDMLTYPATIAPEDLPPIAAGYASFDMLVLEDEGFRQLRAAQLAAIGQWVEGGGSVVAVPRGNLTAPHVDFLNRLAGPRSSSDEPPYSLDETGRLVLSESLRTAAPKMAMFYAGVGRAVVIPEGLGQGFDFNSADWKAATTFLWSVRRAQIGQILGRGTWDFPHNPMSSVGDGDRFFRPDQDGLAQSIRLLLMPDKIEGLPLPIVIVILTLFLLAIAPGDYFLLGRFNCRKYTWVLFVCTSTLFTLATVKIAQSYIGHTDYRTSLTIADLDERAVTSAGRPRIVRTNKFDLQFVATQRVIDTDLKNSLFSDLTERSVYQQNDDWRGRQFTVPQDELADRGDGADLALFEGVMPVSFKVHQQLRQWSPRLTRQTTFGDDAALAAELKIDWSALQPETWGEPGGREALREAILASEPDAELLLFEGSQVYDLTHQVTVGSEQPGQRYYASYSPLSSAGSVLRGLSVRPAGRLFAIVSRISPTGGELLEDLALVDDTDPLQALLIVAVKRDNNWVAFRKLFHRRPG